MKAVRTAVQQQRMGGLLALPINGGNRKQICAAQASRLRVLAHESQATIAELSAGVRFFIQ